MNGSTDVEAKFTTSLMGLARFELFARDGGTKLLYTIIYLALVIYTCMFTFTYLKRVITMAFLTLMAPLVAMTYPIDKMNDGSAQAFNMWLKEYIFNALLQPFHLIIYTIFVSSAMGLAATNPIYAIVALAFITPAEKILRKFFGFEKASTAGTLGAFANMAGGAAAYKMVANAVNHHKGGQGKNGNGGNNIRTKDNKQLKDPNAPSGVDGFTDNNGELPPGNSQTQQAQQSQQTQQPNRDEALERYRAEGFGQNSNGEYYNPWTDEYDASYDPHNDNSYAQQTQQAQMPQTQTPQAQMARNTQQTQQTQIPQRQTLQTQQSHMPQAQTPQTQNNQIPQARTRREKLGAGIRGAGRAIKNRASTTIGNKDWRHYKGKQALKSAGRGALHLAGRAASTVALGTVGLAAGIAGDNLEDVLTYGLGGATLGATVGGNIVTNAMDRVGNRIANSSVAQGFAEGFTGQNQLERQLEKQKQENMYSKDFQQAVNIEYGDGNLSGKELTAATERAADLYNEGITDPSQIAKTMKLENSILDEMQTDTTRDEQTKKRLAREQAVTVQKLAEKIPDEKLSDPDWVAVRTKQLATQIKSKNPNLNDNQVNKNANMMMDKIFKYKKISRP